MKITTRPLDLSSKLRDKPVKQELHLGGHGSQFAVLEHVRLVPPALRPQRSPLKGKEFQFKKLAGNEVYYTA